MSRDDDTQRWEEKRELIIHLYRRGGLARTMELMEGWRFEATKREYVYRLGDLWDIRKNASPKSKAKNSSPKDKTQNASPKDKARRSRGQFSDLNEFRLCLWPPLALDSYRKQVETTGDGEQVLGLLLCRARAVETNDQGLELVKHIERRLGKDDAGDDEEVCSFLRILHGYVLRRAGPVPLEVQQAIEASVHFLMENCCDGETESQRRKPYVIDMPKIMLLCYGMETCNFEQKLQRRKLRGFHLSRLPKPGNEAECECTLKKHLDWCYEKLSSSAARDFSLEILAIPSHDVDSGSLKKAVAYVFCFLLSRHVKEADVVDALQPRRVYEGLQLSVCEVLHTLSALILVGLYSVPRLDLDRLCDSPLDLMEAARRRAGEVAEKLPTHQHLLVIFIEMYGRLTFPTAYSLEEKRLMLQVCGRSEELMMSLGKDETQDEGVESDILDTYMYVNGEECESRYV